VGTRAADRPRSTRVAGVGENRYPVYAAAVFSNNITPFGQAGGEPVSALLISEAADSEYETGLAAIASVDALHFVPTIGFSLVGFTFVIAGTVRLGRNLLFAAGAVAVLAVALPVGSYLGWRYRYELEAAVVRLLTPVVRAVGRLVPGRSAPTSAAIEERIERFFLAIDRVAGDRSTPAQGARLLGAGLARALDVALAPRCTSLAPAVDVPFAAMLLVIPVGSIASVTPSPVAPAPSRQSSRRCSSRSHPSRRPSRPRRS